MGLLKTILITFLVIIGGCTVAVGGCTIGVTKASLGALHSMADVATESHFAKAYKDNPAKAERLYMSVAKDCYGKTMRLKLGKTLPERIIDARVEFDIFEIRTIQAQDESRTQYLEAWRLESDKKIANSLEDKRQRSAVKRYLKDVRKGVLAESLCIANGLSPDASASGGYKNSRR